MSRPFRLSLVVAFVAALVAAAPIASAIAQSPPPPPPKTDKAAHEMHHMATPWKELNAFHDLMAAAWHPAKDSTNLRPAREHALKLVDVAKTWSATKAPASCDTKPVRDAVAAVATDTRAFADLVAKQAHDTTLKRALSALHDRFEIANKACSASHH